MRDLKNNLTTSGKGSTNIQSKKTKGFGYQVLGFGAGGGVNALIAATVSGTCNAITTSGDYKIAEFKNPGTFCVSAGGGALGVADYFVLAGGAGGGIGLAAGGGGGAGGFRESHVAATSGCYTASPLASSTSLPISPGPYPIVVGAGGAAITVPASPQTGNDGSASSFSTIPSAGGGGAGGGSCNANDGGSGGGSCSGTVGSGDTPPVTPAQGTDGAAGGPGSASGNAGGGGGGATAAGTVGGAPTAPAGPGGAGGTTSISASPVIYGGGGGGGVRAGDGIPTGSRSAGTGGPGGGGAGARGGHVPEHGPLVHDATAGTTNRGAGGGGGGMAYNVPSQSGAAGGSGIVYIRYKFQ